MTFGQLKGGPEPLEKEIHKIFGSKREDRFSDPFLKLVKKNSGSFFRTCFITVIYVKDPRTLRKFPQKCQKIAGC